MKIDEIKINAYGNITDKQINFKEGINIVQGENESGKSTLLSYISNALYGISRNKEGKNISDYDKYKPWEGTDFSGKISYTLDNNEKYEIYRDFGKKNPKIYNGQMEEISSKFDTDKKDGSKFFVEQTGIDKQMYLSTVVSMQQEVRLDEKNQNILVQKIANLAGTGEDNVSYKKAMTKLQDKIRDEVGTNKTSQKPINIIQSKLTSIENELERIEPYQDKKYDIDTEKKRLEQEINTMQTVMEMSRELKDTEEENKLAKNMYTVNQDTITENTQKIKDLNEQVRLHEIEKNKIDKEYEEISGGKETLTKLFNEYESKENEIKSKEDKNKENKRNKILPYAIIASVLLIFLLINISILKIKEVNITLIIGIMVTLITGIIVNVKNKKRREIEAEKNRQQQNIINTISNKKEKTREKIEELNGELLTLKNKQIEINNSISMAKGQIELLERNKEQLEDKINELKNSIDSKITEKKKILANEYNEKISREEIQKILEAEDLRSLIAKFEEELNTAKLQLKGLEIEEKNILPQLDNLVNLKEQQEELKEERQELKDKEEIINIAIESLKDAYEEMKTTITPKFTQNLSNSINKISSGKYNKVTISDENGMIIENKKGEYIEADKLSVGTIDQLYLSLRLAMVNDISKESMPIMLDETFAYFDNGRLENVLNFLAQELKEHQSIIFTCTNREKEILDKLKVEYNLIKL